MNCDPQGSWPYQGYFSNIDMARIWFNENESRILELWREVKPDDGIIAPTDDFGEEKDLPIPQRFPADEKKGTYKLNGFHLLHCLVSNPEF